MKASAPWRRPRRSEARQIVIRFYEGDEGVYDEMLKLVNESDSSMQELGLWCVKKGLEFAREEIPCTS